MLCSAMLYYITIRHKFKLISNGCKSAEGLMSSNLLNLTLTRLYIFCTLRAREQKPWSR